jgi:hypothetical protein
VFDLFFDLPIRLIQKRLQDENTEVDSQKKSPSQPPISFARRRLQIRQRKFCYPMPVQRVCKPNQNIAAKLSDLISNIQKSRKESGVIGSWDLESFVITRKDGTAKSWGKNARGLLIYTDEGTMSVSINADVEGDQTSRENQFRSLLFYAGTYEMEAGKIVHRVTKATELGRMGKDLIREATLSGNILTLVGRGDFGVATVVWRKR